VAQAAAAAEIQAENNQNVAEPVPNFECSAVKRYAALRFCEEGSTN
jgi:hypothetical protein